ncbi:sporulation protein YabP [Lachnotalea sp. AF33-28]|uniref:sporulation protein YabP n=1 Tax=Lachnotalea sp. AF33-28 TaxID=2292046 RepID=UPI000E48D3AF|nr:sporulation protein YabP [Lachnotalea sp. AF33-28]RHP36096.1 sporulation protein YabP [Lachnotalea sp. AF33-28]
MEERERPKSGHKLTLTNRNLANITGVKDVISFDVKEILLETEQGMLTIKGQDLHVKRLTLEKGEVDVDGALDSFSYSNLESFEKRGESLFARMFK